MEEVIKKATEWASIDPNPLTSAYVKNLIKECKDVEEHNSDNEKSMNELISLFSKRIAFGTAGLRSKMAPGPTAMNDLIIIQTTQGLARYCQSVHAHAHAHGHAAGMNNNLTAVIGYDHRKNSTFQLSSHRFALFARQVFIKAGFSNVIVLCNDSDNDSIQYVATPLVSFATIECKAACGIMITASHNPKYDNGYKVYWNDGVQIRSPIDNEIKSFIMKPENLMPWDHYVIDNHDYKGDIEETKQLAYQYFQKMKDTGLITGKGKEAVVYAKKSNITIPKITYTAMHGVGYPWAKRSFDEFELPPFLSVPEQQDPNPDFPTVTFPNPEEKGALTIAMEYAQKHGSKIILANDPDADRLAVAEWDKDDDGGTWVTFTGDQIGVMLGHWIYEHIGKDCGQPVAMCASTVSSSMLSKIAQIENFHFEDTLTGFKWIGSKCVSLRHQKPNDVSDSNYRVLFAYEEAIGFCCGEVVPDKDGVSAISVFAEMAYYVYIHKQMTLSQHMQSLYDQYGEFVSHNGYYFYKDPNVLPQIFDHIRNGGAYYTHIQQHKITSIRDLGIPGYDSTTPDHKPTLPLSSSSPIITIKFENGCVTQFRASGTEPKFKYYIEMAGKVGKSRDQVQHELQEMAEVVLNELIRPKELGLVVV